jgi:hypothetical protein
VDTINICSYDKETSALDGLFTTHYRWMLLLSESLQKPFRRRHGIATAYRIPDIIISSSVIDYGATRFQEAGLGVMVFRQVCSDYNMTHGSPLMMPLFTYNLLVSALARTYPRVCSYLLNPLQAVSTTQVFSTRHYLSAQPSYESHSAGP